ncbi:hypothetical protein BLOT_007938 [Blomia tropicalis]|nr:hypothetical protein BLOT_007938 [Blomia tropicalis]
MLPIPTMNELMDEWEGKIHSHTDIGENGSKRMNNIGSASFTTHHFDADAKTWKIDENVLINETILEDYVGAMGDNFQHEYVELCVNEAPNWVWLKLATLTTTITAVGDDEEEKKR